MQPRRASNLADAFRGGVTPAMSPVAPETVLPAPVQTANGVVRAVQPAPTEGNVTSWVRANWGKTVALVLIVLVSVIFIVRTTLVARNRKRVAAEEQRLASAGGSEINWDSFFDGPQPEQPRALSPLQQMQMQQHRPPHPHQVPPPVPVQRVEGLTPLPPPGPGHAPPGHAPVHRPPPPQHQAPSPAHDGTRGVQHRMPPADSPLGGGAMAMPESTRPIRQPPAPGAPAAGAADATFVIPSEDLPVTAGAPEVEPKKKGEGEQPPLQPPSAAAAPNAAPASTDFTRL